ncbi:hypothetical protein L7F22_017162 [Adiantum nelumboides]|nr:hypothetical protein [Adiantum nelumboides]
MRGPLALTLPVRSSCSSLQAAISSLALLPQNRNCKTVRHGSRLSIRASSETDSEAQTSDSPSSSSSKSTAATQTAEISEANTAGREGQSTPSVTKVLNKEISQAVRKTAATFAPRSSTKTKNPAVPGSTLYTIFEVQGYLSMCFGGLLSYNLIFPSSDPDIWRLMGMWSVWMFTIPSLRARDCSNKEKDALNYLFLGIPLINVVLPLFWKSFAAVWTADVLTFFVMYAWKVIT